jgi:dihydropteroate synthase
MRTLQIGQLRLEPGRRTYIMGIINVTPDSFAGDGVPAVETALERGRALIDQGADLLDVGGESTRPGAQPVAVDEELRRVIPVIEGLVGTLAAVVSVDTTKAAVARHAVRVGAAMINDVSALRADADMARVASEAEVPIVLMHGWGMTVSSPPRPVQRDIIAKVRDFLTQRVDAALAAGIPHEHLLVDPGFGFGKTVEENLDVLRRLGELRALHQPIVIGTSRKGTIGKVLGGLPVQERLEGTAATVAVAIVNGADIVRVHDVRAMARVARMTDAIVRGDR